MHTCRFCGKLGEHSEVVKYGKRHYAHFHCYLNKGRKLADLQGWQVGRFPWRLLQKHGLLEEADRLNK